MILATLCAFGFAHAPMVLAADTNCVEVPSVQDRAPCHDGRESIELFCEYTTQTDRGTDGGALAGARGLAEIRTERL